MKHATFMQRVRDLAENPCAEIRIMESEECVLRYKDYWYVVTNQAGLAVVLVHDAGYGSTPEELFKRNRRRLDQYSWKEITEPEYESYHALCDLPQIEIYEFVHWEIAYHEFYRGR